jgi:hypothetical protein
VDRNLEPSFVCKWVYCTRRGHPDTGRPSVVLTVHRFCFATQRTYNFTFPKLYKTPATAKRQTARDVQAVGQRLKFAFRSLGGVLGTGVCCRCPGDLLCHVDGRNVHTWHATYSTLYRFLFDPRHQNWGQKAAPFSGPPITK